MKNNRKTNNSGNLVKGSKEVNIMHMDAKPLMVTFMVWGLLMFLFFMVLAGLGAYAIHTLDQKIDHINTIVDNN